MKARNEALFSDGCAFMPYVCAGDPDASFTKELIMTLVQNGADAIELGIPFSDPIADGKTIQAASQRALAGGMTPGKALALLKDLRDGGMDKPVFIMTYYNIIFANGVDAFVRKAKEAGADGLIVPDLPIEECDELKRSCDDAGLSLVQFITPDSSDERIKGIGKKAGGFIYAVAVQGITGTRDAVSQEALALIRRARRICDEPVVVGFGISDPAQAKAYADAGANGVIVGSGLIKLYEGLDHEAREDALARIGEFTKRMKDGLKDAK